MKTYHKRQMLVVVVVCCQQNFQTRQCLKMTRSMVAAAEVFVVKRLNFGCCCRMSRVTVIEPCYLRVKEKRGVTFHVFNT